MEHDTVIGDAQHGLAHDASRSPAGPRTTTPTIDARDDALVAIGATLAAAGYRFTCITPESHAIVRARSDAPARTLRDVFGWSRPFARGTLPADVFALLEEAEALEPQDNLFSSSVRYSTFADGLLVHSAWPTRARDSVFLGPDTYRFARLIDRALHDWSLSLRAGDGPLSVFDVGCGTGAGGILAARLLGRRARILFGDVNEAALRFTRVNVRMARVPRAHVVESDVLSVANAPLDLVLANPPYLNDLAGRLYAHGGGALGTGLSARIVTEALGRLAPGGLLVLYTGSPVVEGIDTFRAAIDPVLASHAVRFRYRYEEIDPDVFGDVLAEPAYARVERLAVVGLVAHRIL